MTEKYCYSLDGEGYHGPFDSREGALEEAIQVAHDHPEGPSRVHTAVVCDPPVREWVEGRADWLVDKVRDCAYDETGDISENWLLRVDAAHEKRLGELLADAFAAWLKETGNEPSFFTVHDTREHVVPDAEVSP